MLYQFGTGRMTGVRTAGDLPTYLRISERLTRDIAAGRLEAGTRLPPERQMAADWGVSVGTLRKALAELEARGLLSRVQGSGNYVQAQPDVRSVYALFRLERVSGGGLPTARVLDVRRLAKPRSAPSFGPSAEAHRIRRLRRLDDIPVALEEIWLDADAAPRLTAADLSESLYRFYADRLGLVIGRVEDRIGVGTMPDWGPRDGPAPGAPAGYIERLGRAEGGAAVEFSRTWFDPDKARYVSRMGKG